MSPDATAGFAGMTALVVEDDRLLRGLLRSALGRMFGQVLEAADSQQALDLDCAEIDFLLADLRLPGPLNGLELARELTGRCPELRVVFCTGHGPTEFRDCGIAPHEILYIAKPFGLDTLHTTITTSFSDARGSLRVPAGVR